MQGGLQGKNGAQSSADPYRDGHGLGDFFHEQGTCGIQCLLVGNAVTVACERRVLQTGAKKGPPGRAQAMQVCRSDTADRGC